MSEPATTTQAASAATSTSPKFEFFEHPLQRVLQPLLLACECSTPYLSMILTMSVKPILSKKTRPGFGIFVS